MSNSPLNQGEKLTIGFVGLGNMGMPTLQRVSGAGYDAVFFARRDEVIATAQSHGAVACDSTADCARKSEVLFLNLRTDEQIVEVALGPDGVLSAMRPGSTLIVHTTCTPETAAQLAAVGAERGVGVVDAPVDGIPNDILNGTLSVFMGADERSASIARPLLEIYSARVEHIGSPGQGHRAKMVMILMLGAHMKMMSDAVDLAERLDIDVRSTLTEISKTSASSTALQYALAFSEDPRDFAEAVRPFLSNDITAYDDFFAKSGVDGGMLLEVARAVAIGGVESEATERLQQWERTSAAS